MQYANVIVDISHENLNKIFQFVIPKELEEKIKIGSVVEFPFGQGNRKTKGYVVGITRQCNYDMTKMKALYGLMEDQVSIEAEFIELAEFISRNYGATMLQSLKTVMPLKHKVQKREESLLHLSVEIEKAKQYLVSFYTKKYKAKARLLEALLEAKDNTLKKSTVIKEKISTLPVIKGFEKEGIICIETIRDYRDPTVKLELEQILSNVTGELELTKNQKECVEDIWLRAHSFDPPKAHLLHGVTGSGKTLCYMELIRRTLKEEKQVIVLIPEIALTYQTVERFRQMFGGQVSFIHSKLSQGEKFDQFEKALNGEIQIMVGPRSALFTPFPRLGLIILDEEHETSYKSDSTPKYHAREVAIERVRKSNGFVVLGSATPSMESYTKAQSGEYGLYELTERYQNRNLAKTEIVDMREELLRGNRSMISDRLDELIVDRIQKKEQIMLFLNRRGYAGFLSCRSCGEVIKCPHCDVSLSLHKNDKLMCHYCGYETVKVNACPKCKSKYIGAFKAGTQQVEEMLQRKYPAARILRMDADTTRKKGGHGEILNAFSKGEADILLGTQMIVKGHDFKNVTLVGALAADTSLFVNDYHAGERTFHLLTQAAGRAGRGEKEGIMVIQTYTPENYSIQYAARQDYKNFYEYEMTYRCMSGYPPAIHMLAILMVSQNEGAVSDFAQNICSHIKEIMPGDTRVIGVADATIGKLNDYYRKVIYIKQKNYDILTKIKENVEIFINNLGQDTGCYIQFDFDPMHTY